MDTNYPFTDHKHYSYTLDNILEYISNFQIGWKIKILMDFSIKYSNMKRELIELAYKYSLEEGLVIISNKIIKKNDFIDQMLLEDNKNNLEKLLKDYISQRFLYEEAVRSAKNIGVIESIRLCYYDLFLVCWAAGDYESSLKYLNDAFIGANVDYRPHNVYIYLCQLYLITDNFSALNELVTSCGTELWKKDRKLIQTTERNIVQFLNLAINHSPQKAANFFIKHFDEILFREFIFILPPVELCKIASILIFSSFTFSEISLFFNTMNLFPESCEKSYKLSYMYLCICNNNIREFMQYFHIFIPHIYNDLFLHKSASKLVNLTLENMMANYCRPFISIYYKNIADVFNMDIKTTLQFLENILKTDLKEYKIDYKNKCLIINDHSRIISEYKKASSNEAEGNISPIVNY